MKCKVCNNKIVDYEFLSNKFNTSPDMCENCRRTKRRYRKSSKPISRELLHEVKNVVVSNKDISFEKEPKKRNKDFIFYTVVDNKRVFIYVNQYLVECSNGEYQIKNRNANVRIMRKEIDDESYIYCVVEASYAPTRKTINLKETVEEFI